MGPSRPIQRNLNINNPRLSFELSTLAYFRYLIKVFTLLVSVFALGTKQTKHCERVSPCQVLAPTTLAPWSQVSPVSEVSLVIVTMSPTLNPPIKVCVFNYFANGGIMISIADLQLREDFYSVYSRSCNILINSQSGF